MIKFFQEILAWDSGTWQRDFGRDTQLTVCIVFSPSSQPLGLILSLLAWSKNLLFENWYLKSYNLKVYCLLICLPFEYDFAFYQNAIV